LGGGSLGGKGAEGGGRHGFGLWWVLSLLKLLHGSRGRGGGLALFTLPKEERLTEYHAHKGAKKD